MDYKNLIDWAASDNVDYKRFCKGVAKLCKQIDEDCAEGEKELRFMDGTFTPSDIIGELKK